MLSADISKPLKNCSLYFVVHRRFDLGIVDRFDNQFKVYFVKLYSVLESFPGWHFIRLSFVICCMYTYRTPVLHCVLRLVHVVPFCCFSVVVRSAPISSPPAPLPTPPAPKGRLTNGYLKKNKKKTAIRILVTKIWSEQKEHFK